MRYRCPSCFVRWEDHKEPVDFCSEPLCIFCSDKHTLHDLLHRQMMQLESIDPKDMPKVLRLWFREMLKAFKEEHPWKED